MKIRIAVAVTSGGSWAPFPSEAASEWWRRAHEREYRGTSHVIFVEADVPMPPEPQTVAGEVRE